MSQKTYFVFFIVLAFCSTLLSDKILSKASTEKKIIDVIYDFDLYTSSLMYPCGSDLLKEDIEFFSECELTAVCTKEDAITGITMQFDSSNVNTLEKGHYELSLDLIYDKEHYILAEHYTDHYTIPVCISDPEEFEVFLTYTSDYQTVFRYLYSFDNYRTIRTFCCQSDKPLSAKELKEINWVESTASPLINPTPDAIVISSEFFSDNNYYYLKFENEEMSSNFICVKKQNGLIISTPLEGDRDGGDFSSYQEETIRQVTKATPTPAATASSAACQEKKTSSANTVTEEKSTNTTSVSGKRLRLMAESNPNFIPFDQNGTTLEIPTNYLLSLKPADNEVLSVTVTSNTRKSPTVTVTCANKTLKSIPGSRLTQKNSNETLYIDETGNYEFKQQAGRTPEKKNYTTFISAVISGILLFSTGSFALIKKKGRT